MASTLNTVGESQGGPWVFGFWGLGIRVSGLGGRGGAPVKEKSI